MCQTSGRTHFKHVKNTRDRVVFFSTKGKGSKQKLQHVRVSPLRCLHVTIIAAQFSVEKSQISYMYIYI